MRTMVGVIILSSVLACSAMAQGDGYRAEVSFSGTGGWISTSTTSAGHSASSDAQGFLTLAARCGIFVYDGLSFEPEIALTCMEGTEPAYVLAGNISYTFSPANSIVRPFVLAGVGIANALPLGPNPIGKTTDGMDIFMVNAGAGVKVFLTDFAALRLEYRYQRFSHSYEYNMSYYPSATKSTVDYVYNMHRVFVGVSIFL